MKKKLIGIIGALEIEVEGLKAVLTSPETVEHGGMKFTVGELGLQKVVVVKSGMGKVFAGICAQTMIDVFFPDLIINTGIAGALRDDVGILDVVIAKRTLQHDVDSSPIGDPVGLVSGLPDIYLPCDEEAAEKIAAAARSLGVNCLIGTTASGDTFVADKEKKEWIRSFFGADACDMEGGAIGQVCVFRNVPYCVLRTMSDGGNEDAEMDYPKFAKLAANQSIRIVRAFAESLAE